jgi:hypothetical protein
MVSTNSSTNLEHDPAGRLHGVHAPHDPSDEVGNEVVGPRRPALAPTRWMRPIASPTSMGWSGIGSGAGPSGRPHSSVPRVRSLRAGLPVVDRDRTVSPDPACRKLSLTAGAVSASAVVSHTRPAPHAVRAEGHAGGQLPAAGTPPAASTGMGPDGVDDLVNEQHGGDEPVCPPASVPWATTRSAAAACLRACSTDSARAAHRDARRRGLAQ